jgi:phospholipase C
MENQNQFNGLDTFEHVVVLMLENRSFDNLLGYLYAKEEVPNGKTFDGLNTGNYDNPVPPRANGYSDHPTIATSRATDYSVPFPDPGEEYQHVNTQIFNTIDPASNLGIEQQNMQPPYNLPTPVPTQKMKGFINDYESNLRATFGQIPTYDQFKGIMECFQPDQIPVMATLAKQFAVFDHWYCSVPSQTYCNRAFWHAANSAGKVINPLEEDGSGFPGIDGDFKGMASWMEDVWKLPTLFDRMSKKDISWKVYSPIYPLSLTEIIHGYSLKHPFHTHEYSDFACDLHNGNLPQYSFVEPQFLHKHNDQHPSAYKHELTPGTVYLGEELIFDVYNEIRNSSYKDKTLFIITHDEHGGCFDHVNPPAGVPPVPGMDGQCNFGFDRLGVRVPMIMVSSHIKPNTIINEQFDHTSFIKTMCQKWNLDSLSDRDKSDTTQPFTSVFSQHICNDWHEIQLAPILTSIGETNQIDDPLNGLQKAMLTSLLHIEKVHGLGNTSSDEIDTIGKMMEFIKRFV